MVIVFPILASIIVVVRAREGNNGIRATSRQHLTASYYKAPLEAGEGKKWARIWGMSDEFWRSRLHHIWEPYNSNWDGRQPGYFKSENVLVKSHRLELKSCEEHSVSVPEELKLKGYGNFSTSFIRTKNRHKYGYFEISAKLMDSKISSAFWFAYNEPGSHNIDRSQTWWTEIDVFEYSTSKKNGVNHRFELHTNAHVHRAPGYILEDLDDSIPHKTPESFTVTEDLTKDFHVYALDWCEDYLALPKTFEIDYVRSWKRVDE